MKSTNINLLPNQVNSSPDYFCTWQSQLYISNNAGVQEQRDSLTEKAIFGSEYSGGWADFYNCKEDLIFMLDDSWDIPIGDTVDNSSLFGSLILDKERFPSFSGKGIENRDAMKKLSEAIKAKGWRGVGGWVCAQKAKAFADEPEEEYWINRLKWSDYADWLYWKVDWGLKGESVDFRRMLNRLQKDYAPNLTLNQAMTEELTSECKVFRTYDVPAIMSIPMTMEKLKRVLQYNAKPGCDALVDCEDEAYVAAALGCVMGIMRHPRVGDLPNGNPDPSFPALHRNIKTKTDEVARAARWHRIAPAFSVNGDNTFFDSNILTDTWKVEKQEEEIEAWWKYKNGDTIIKTGPARISRGIKPPVAKPDKNGIVPFIVASKNPFGAVSVATLGRTLGREWVTPLCNVVLDAEDANLIGIFGEYAALTIYSSAIKGNAHILAQDLLSDKAVDITDDVKIKENHIKIDGEIIHNVGTAAGHLKDTSEPGMILKISGN